MCIYIYILIYIPGRKFVLPPPLSPAPFRDGLQTTVTFTEGMRLSQTVSDGIYYYYI